MNDKVIVALDFSDLNDLNEFLDKFDHPLFVKVGMELYYKYGNEIIHTLKSKNHKIFLDLKLHDIDNTVYKAIKNLALLDVDIINVHASGGLNMMEKALQGVREVNSNTKIIAVTQLTSTSQEMIEKQQLVNVSILDSILNYAKITKKAGLDGVVCSPLEVSHIKKKLGDEFLCVTPGIRYEDSQKDEQVRITDPLKALNLGCDYIVVGRIITNAVDPVLMYNQVSKDFSK